MNEIDTTATSRPPVVVATADMCIVCFDTLLDKLQKNNSTNNKANHVNGFSGNKVTTNNADVVSCPLFVTWEMYHRKHQRWELRGCIGSLSPVPSVQTGIPHYAVTAALHDTRFRPITIAEIPYLRVSVSLLIQYESCHHVYDWIVGQHGITITWYSQDTPKKNSSPSQKYSATYLPEVAQQQQWTQLQTIESLIRKAGYTGPITTALLQQIQCTRYQSSKYTLEFHQYQQQQQQPSSLSFTRRRTRTTPALVTPEGSSIGNDYRDACSLM
jgi:uncharacterized protein (TIGR00296 family)